MPLGLGDGSPEKVDEGVVLVFVESEVCEEEGSSEELAEGVDEFWRKTYYDADLSWWWDGARG